MSDAPDPAGFTSLALLPQAARSVLPPSVWDWFSGGAADEYTVRSNEAAWPAWRIWPRVLRSLGGALPGQDGVNSLTTTLAGIELAHPLLLAPVALQRLAHPEGEWATALAAAAQRAGMVLSVRSSVAVETVGRAMSQPGAGPFWFQLYAIPDRSLLRRQIERAEAAGCQALVLTVDAPVQGVRDREHAAGFALPSDVHAAHEASVDENMNAWPGQNGGLTALLNAAPDWSTVEWLRAQTRLPVWIKGVLHPDDARIAQATGAVAGLIVSNHGGRTLDTAVETAWALPRVVDALNNELPVLVDGGLRRGTDVFKALALGARAVLLGRPQVWALAAGGPHGVARWLRLVQDELRMAMALSGCRCIADIRRALLVPPGQ